MRRSAGVWITKKIQNETVFCALVEIVNEARLLLKFDTIIRSCSSNETTKRKTDKIRKSSEWVNSKMGKTREKARMDN